MEEKKKWIKGYEGLYWVTNTGKIISAERYDRFNRKHGGEITPKHAGRGYCFVILFKDGKREQRYVHRLVAQAFIPNPDNKPEVDHIDNDITNNTVSNLRWATHKENQNNEITRARMLEDTSKFISQKGADNPFSRKVKMYSMDGTYLQTFDSIREAALFANTSDGGIGKVCRGSRISAGGYLWKYEGEAKRKIEVTSPKQPTNKRAILQLSLDGKVIAEYESVQAAAVALRICYPNIIHCAKGEIKTYKGYKWRYKE